MVYCYQQHSATGTDKGNGGRGGLSFLMVEVDTMQQPGTANQARKQPRPFTAPTDSSRDYRSMYAALFRFHERHNQPPTQAADLEQYWSAVNDDLIETAAQFGNDEYMGRLLLDAMDELERQQKAVTAATEF